MGEPKPGLVWGATTLLAHVAGVVATAVAGGPVVVSARAGQELPALPAATERVDDPPGSVGPLAGIIAALERLTGRADAVVVVACDLPLLTATLLSGLTEALSADLDAVVPVVGGHPQPLAAVYAAGVLEAFRAACTEGRNGPRAALSGLRVSYVDFADGVPFLNVNDPAAFTYATALATDV